MGQQDYSLAPLARSEAPLVRKHLYSVLNLQSLVTMENNPLRGLFRVSSPRPEQQLVTPRPTAPNMKFIRV